MDKLLSTSQVAGELGVSRRRVQKLITDGRLKAVKLGRDYFVKPHDLATVRERKPGRPKSS